MEIVELKDKKDVLIEHLSSGELQKANIALALVSGADMLLLDEPSSNIDLTGRVKIMNILKNLTKQGVSIVVVLHDINVAAAYGDKFMGFTKCHNVITADKSNFFTEKNLNEIFGINFKVINDENNFNIQIYNN